jgi:hypothetical protein
MMGEYMPDATDHSSKLDALLGRALRDSAFRERMIADPTKAAAETGLSADELKLVTSGLALGSSLHVRDPRTVMWCTEKTCNEKGGARVVIFSPDESFKPEVPVVKGEGKVIGR